MVLQVLKSPKSRRKKLKQSKIEIHGDKKLVVKLPGSDSSSQSGPKRMSSPVLIELDDSESGKSGRSGRQTRNSSKRKVEDSPKSVPVKKQKINKKDVKQAKKEEKPKKDENPKEKLKKEDKSKSNGKAENGSGYKEETLNEFLKKDDLKKWHYVVDVISPTGL